jgi:MoaA/NifB/PqqE/SkfB family radical SAM enzyme
MKERDLLTYIDFVKKLGADIVSLGRVLSIGRGASQGFSLSPYEVNEFFRILKKHDFFNGYVQWSWFGDLDESRGCDRIGQLPCVSPLGIHPCVFHQDIKLGDLKDFEKIVWSNFFQSLDMVRRASRTGLPQIRFSCSECIRCLPDYLKQAKKMTLITY